MEDGTWNKALCFVYIACTMGSVGGIYGIVNRQTGGSMSAEGGGTGGNHAGQADAGGGWTLARVNRSHRRLWRKEGRLDQAREGRKGGRGCRKSFRDVRKVNLLG